MRLNVPPEEFFTDRLEPKIVQIRKFDQTGAAYETPFDEYLRSDASLQLTQTDFAKLRGSMYLRVIVEAISVEEAAAIQREATEKAR